MIINCSVNTTTFHWGLGLYCRGKLCWNFTMV